MPICFVATQPQGGCPERVVVSGPFFVVDPRTNRFYFDQNKKLVPDPTAASAFFQKWCAENNVPIAQCPYTPFFVADDPKAPKVVAIQFTPMAVQQHAPVNAVFNSPTGNGQVLTMPPEQVPQNQIRHDPTGFEMQDIDNSALPRNSDPVMGDMDPSGGTFTDYDPVTKQEVQRTTLRPYGPNPAQRQG